MAEPEGAVWRVDADWEGRARRIGERLRHRDDAVRAVAVAGDYARGRAWEGSLLRVVLFRADRGELIDEGGVQEEDGVGWAVDRMSMGVLAGDQGGLLSREPLASDLADLRVLRMTDAGLGGVLAEFRDRYYSADGRRLRAGRALQRARVLLEDYRAYGRTVDAVDVVRSGVGPALSALIGEYVDLARLGRGLRAGGRILRQPELGSVATEALGLEGRSASEVSAAVESLYGLALSHVRARLPEVGAALQPRLERALVVGRRASASLSEAGDGAGAVWALVNGAAEMDGLVESASPGWRERDDYAVRAAAVYGAPDAEGLAELRRMTARGAD